HEAELIDELVPFKNKMVTLYKNSTNGFMHPDFINVFDKIHADEFVCVGCCTDICVLQFALSLKGYINQHNLKVGVSVVRDTVETFGLPGHEQGQFNEMAITLMANAGIKIIDSYKEIME
ncbi:MAG: isochorismatase family protein, partial [Anaerorhabdus sp.]